jgi:lysophospholipase L1-like esterase
MEIYFMRKSTCLILNLVALSLLGQRSSTAADAAAKPEARALAPPVEMTVQEDHRRMMELLEIKSLRPDANPNNLSAPNAANYDESKANPYPELPDPLVLKDGRKVTTAEMWWSERREEIVEDFDREIYGRVPPNVPPVTWTVTSTSAGTNGDVPTITKQLVGRVDNSAYPLIDVNIELALTTPTNATGPVPLMLEFGFNFGRFGRVGPGRRPGGPGGFSGGGQTWQQQLLASGWGYATVTPNSVQADNGQGLTRGIIGLTNQGQPRKLDDWGALRAWAWGASRALDYLETDKAVDSKKVGVVGLSRYGKAALIAMAYDERFAIGFIGSSGAGGAKLFRRNFGELVENLAGGGAYHWMAGNFLKYAGPLTAGDLPVDSHELIALCAPRPVFISYGASTGPGAEGQWVDQRGSFMAAVAAGPVYQLLGKKDLGTAEFPPLETALVDGEIAFRQHRGGHTTGPNWPTFLDWAGRYIKAPAIVVANAPTGLSDATSRPSTDDDRPLVAVATDEAAPQANPLFPRAHQMLLEKRKQGVIDIYFLGDSITRRWQATDYPEHKKNWDQNFFGWNAANFGWGGDTTQNVLWRLQNGEMDGVHPKVVVLMIGTNNLAGITSSDDVDGKAEEVVRGVRAILNVVREKVPKAKIVLMGITPRNDMAGTAAMSTINKVNARIASFADGELITYLNINDKLADTEGHLFEGVTEDRLHLSIKGYQIWADALKPLFTQWLGHPTATDQAPPASGIPIGPP